MATIRTPMLVASSLAVLWLAAAGCSVERVTYTPEPAPMTPTPPPTAPTCTDTVQNGAEADVDCGGSCAPCDALQRCAAAADCITGVCDEGLCAAPSCVDQVRNGDETDVDCGGGCGPCAAGTACGTSDDCASGVCTGVCQEATCSDAVANGDESDADCGGSCGPCADGKRCGDRADCSSGVCANSACEAPTCADEVVNGDETDVDCGGPACAACAAGRACAIDAHCASTGVCDGQICRLAQSCAEIHQRRPAVADGVYTIAPMGATPFEAVCDMTRDDGGWTLLLKSADGAEFAYSAAIWTDESVVNPGDLTTAPSNAKYPSFARVPVSMLRGDLDGFRYTKEIADRTALQMFTGPADFVNDFPTFNTGDPRWSTQPNCHVFGINMTFGLVVRFGWSANQENQCLSNDTVIGLGVSSHGAGYQCGSTQCDQGPVDLGGNGLLWGR